MRKTQPKVKTKNRVQRKQRIHKAKKQKKTQRDENRLDRQDDTPGNTLKQTDKDTEKHRG